MVHEARLNFFTTLCMFRDSVRQKEGPSFGFAPRGRGRLARVMLGAVFCSGPSARWVAHPKVARILRPGADAAGGLGTMRGSVAPTLGPGKLGQRRPYSAPATEQKAPRGQRPGREKFVRGWGRGPRAPHRTMARASAGRPSATPPLRRAAAQYLVRVLPAARGRRWPAGAARHVHVQGAGERAPQRPHPPRQPHGRQAQAQPARQQSHRGAAAASSDHRRAQAQEEEEEEPPPPATAVAARARAIAAKSPVQPPSGPRRGWGQRGRSGRSGGRAAFSSPPAALPCPERQRPQLRFPPGARTDAGGAFFPYPMSGGGPAGEAGERLPFRTLPVAAAWAPNGGRSGETSERGYESLANPRWEPAGLPVFPCLSVAGGCLDHTLAGFLLNRSDGLRVSFPSPDTLRPRSVR